MKDKLLSSGEAARQAGVSPDTLRHYERTGLLPPPIRSTNGYRRYPESVLEQVGFIRGAIALGFTIRELSHLLRKKARGAYPCAEVRKMASEKLTELENRVREIRKLQKHLRQTIASWDARLSALTPGEPAYLLHSLKTPVERKDTRIKTPAVNTKRSGQKAS